MARDRVRCRHIRSRRLSGDRIPRRSSAGWAISTSPCSPRPLPACSMPPTAVKPDRISALKELADLKAQGVLTESEFESEKARILAS
nr:SHOCT domain-containing protein [Nocardia higoensis]